MLSSEELPGVCLASQINCLGVHLIGDVDKQLVEVVVGVVVWLEGNLDFVDLLGLDGPLRRDEEEGPLLRKIVYTRHLGYKLKVDREATDVGN